ncbi:MAG: ABC transporter permease [Actinobacteria bacterium]|nr:ABC transporter permease [Actinomycetota bacterium]
MRDFFDYLWQRRDHLFDLAVAHAKIVLTAIAIAIVISILVGVLVYRRPRIAAFVLAVQGASLTIPSLALFGLLIPIAGLGYRPVLIALVIYALLPITRNTVTGLRGVDPAVLESAEGMGMGRLRRLLRIELPLAWPVILTGIRVSTVMILGIAAIGAYVDGPGLGRDIFDGLARIGSPTAVDLVVGGTLGVIVLALLSDVFYFLLGRLTTSKGIR